MLGAVLEKLSSGLRINRAGDDPSGLAISERLRGQVNGLTRAAMNVQDGNSLLQTAEGALNETQLMLQRLRELAVQAANGVLTANDRGEIQKEVLQLVEEIDRIANRTEFNTRKLLDGTGAALWSADSSDIRAVIRGAVLEGNYRLTKNAMPGTNQVLKSDIFTIANGYLGITLEDANDTGIADVVNPQTVPAGDYTVNVNIEQVPGAADTVTIVGKYQFGGSTSQLTLTGAAAPTVAEDANGNAQSHYVIAEVTTGGTVSAGGGGGAKVRWSNDNGVSWHEGVAVAASGADTVLTDATNTYNIRFTDGDLTAGDKWLLAANNLDEAVANDYDRVRITAPDAQTGPVYVFDAGDRAGGPPPTPGALDNTTTTFTIGTIDESTGAVQFGSVGATFTTPANGTGDAQFNVVGAGGVASASTPLYKAALFYDGNGNLILQNPQKLTVWGNNAYVDIYLYGSDTIATLADKIRTAITSEKAAGGVGMGTDVADVDRNVVVYVTTPTPGSDEAVAGTLVARSTMPDTQGRLAFSGSEELLRALSLAQVQDPTDTLMTVTVQNAHDLTRYFGPTTGTVVDDNVLRGVIQGVEVVIDPLVDVGVSWDNTNKAFVFSSASGEMSENLHIVDYSVALQIGANQGQTMVAAIGQMDTEALGINNLLVVNPTLAQEGIGKVDSAINQVSSERAKLGAYMNRLSHLMANISIQAENLTASESRVRDLDMAREMITFTRHQIMLQAGTAMLAQANAVPQAVLQLIR